jgi:hypothetical protein
VVVSESLSTTSPSSPPSVAPTITDNARTIVAAQTMSSSAKASIPHMLLLAAVALMIL